MALPAGFIEEIKNRNQIEDVVSSYVTLRRAGSNSVGLCPFHSEKTPSFTVFSGTSSFYCFGCGAGGDVISFVMRMENLDYLSAVETLAARCGMKMPEDEKNASSVFSKNEIFKANREAAKYFYSALMSEAGAPGRAYLAKRGVSSAAAKHFGLGYSPGFDGLRKHMNAAGYGDELLYKAFLCGRGRNGKPYDYFHGRLIFPIIDLAGNVVAFGGRYIEQPGEAPGTAKGPKYLNTSDTDAFKKSKNLFALNFAKATCSEQIILCEGYMDVIAVHTAGFTNCVATLGTAITPDHARILAKYTKKVIISYDSDQAGTSASKKAIELLTEAGLDVTVLRMTGAKDPDEFIKKYGAEAFGKLLRDSQSRFDFTYSQIVSKYDMDSPEQKMRATSEITAAIAAMRTSTSRELYAGIAADRLGFSRDSMRRDVEREAKRLAARNRREIKESELKKSMGYGDRVNRDAALVLKAARAEEAILGILILQPENMQLISRGETDLSENDFVTDFGKRVFRALGELSGEGDVIGPMNGIFTSDEMSRIIKMSEDRRAVGGNTPDVLADYVKALKKCASDAENQTLEDIINSKKDKI
ncbi:MAG: DNA primase [Clostridia bacterium]|nr:DNA primase [Clostridia bacterium]